jgi:hypothetical protein
VGIDGRHQQRRKDERGAHLRLAPEVERQHVQAAHDRRPHHGRVGADQQRVEHDTRHGQRHRPPLAHRFGAGQHQQAGDDGNIKAVDGNTNDINISCRFLWW